MKKRLWQEAVVYKRLLGVTAGFNIFGSVLAIGQALCFAYIINGVFLENNGLPELLPWFYGLAFVIAGRALASYGADINSYELASKVKTGLRGRLSAKIFEMGPARLSGEACGSLANLLADGVEKVEPYFSKLLPQLFHTATAPLFTLAVLFYLDKSAFFIMLISVPLIPAFMILIGKAAREKNEAQFAKLSAMNAHFLDVLRGLATLKLFGRSKEQTLVVARISEEFQSGALSVLKIAFLSSLALELIATMGTALVAVTVGLKVLYGYSGFRDAFFVLMLTPGFYLPFRQLGAHYHSAGESLAAAEKIYVLLDRQIGGRAAALLGFGKTDKISFLFENVSFSYNYNKGNDAALKGVSFRAAAGEKIALVGPSGAGKSTVAFLLLKFIACQEGAIMVNGVPLERIKKSDWLANIAYVPQRPHLFAASIADNIRFGSGAPLSSVANAAREAQIHDFISSLPEGYETIIGEGGRSLSGGEAQRISLARAFLRRAGLVILDEAAAAVDVQNQTALTGAFRQLFAHSTVLMITHRLSSITACDRIIVLQNGRVAEQGTHRELLTSCGVYQMMASSSFYGDNGENGVNK